MLYQRKQATYSENKIFPFAKISDLRTDLIAHARKLATIHRKHHAWENLNDEELLKSAQLYQTDPETGKTGITLAGILLLGNDNLILSAVPHHRTDLILRRNNLDRYDDRDDVRTDLIESFERIMAFVGKHLPDPFYLEGQINISFRDAIFREVASNLLIHREYLNPYPAKLIIERDQIRTENSNKPHGFGPINPNNFSPYPKNPVIAKFFREIGFADELGSGVRNIIKYGEKYGNKTPELIEGDIFRITIGYPKLGSTLQPSSEIIRPELQPELRPESRPELQSSLYLKSKLESGIAAKILLAIQNNPLSKSQIAKSLGHATVSGELKKQISRLLSEQLIEMTLPDKPNSRLQRYKITTNGLAFFEE